MRLKIIFCLALTIGFALFSSEAFSQESKITTVQSNTSSFAQNSSIMPVVPNAKIEISFKGKKAYCNTNGKGEFAIYLPDTSKTFIKAKEYQAILTIDLPNIFKDSANNKILNYMLKQSEAPYWEFTLFYDKGKKQLVIRPNNNIKDREGKIMVQKNQGTKREKGDASKVGDKYQGEVAHF